MGDVLGKYRIDGLIAEGGMARIYRAKTEGIGGVDKVVALKCIKGAMSEDDNYVRMLLDEARITVRMTHKNICQVYGLEHDGDTYFMVMELVDGVSLADLSSHLFGLNRVFPIEAAVFIAMEVCAGLSYAHRMTDDNGEPLGIVHRDVNPQNICISKEGEVKLIDFGIAKAKRASTETQVGTIKGKFNYMSPEQARGDRVDQRADVFALGAVLYEMLCGHMLYPLSIDDMRLRTKTRMADFVPIETYLPNIPEKLRLIVAKALARDINQRFASSRDFLLALTQFFHDGCKVYDSINLSLLVEKYLAQKSKNEAISSEQRKKVSLRNEIRSSDPLVDASDTTIMNADAARRIALGTPLGEMYPTAVYAQPAFQEHPANSSSPLSADCSVARSVDLSVSSPGNESTVMVNMKDVKGRKTNAFEFVSEAFAKASAYFNQKIQMMSEKTLAIIAVSLTFLLVVVIIIIFVQFREVPPPSDSIDNAVERVQDADTTPSTDD